MSSSSLNPSFSSYSVIHGKDSPEHPVMFDMWSFTHFLSGMVLYCLLLTWFPNLSILILFLIMFLIHLCYETKDYYQAYINPTYNGEKSSLWNSIGDQICASLGFGMALITGIQGSWLSSFAFALVTLLNFGLSNYVVNYYRHEYHRPTKTTTF